jgi:hypothetical protein
MYRINFYNRSEKSQKGSESAHGSTVKYHGVKEKIKRFITATLFIEFPGACYYLMNPGLARQMWRLER